MPLEFPLVLEKEQLAEVPEALRPLYVEKEGKLHLDAVPKKDLHRFLESKRAAEEQVRKTAQQWEGFDPEEARVAVEERRQREQGELLKKGDVDAIVTKATQKVASEAQKKHAALEAELATERAASARLLRDDAAGKTALEMGVKQEFLDDVRLHVKEAFEVKGGEVVARDGSDLKLAKFIKDLVATRKGWLGDSVGGGTQPRGSNGMPTPKRSQMTDSQKLAFIKQYGKDKYLSLPEK